jgi:hypothetical protein
MITKREEDTALPAASFINVGCYLRHQSIENENDLRSVNSDLTESKNGILIVDHFDPTIISYDSVDVEAIVDMQETIARKNRIIQMLTIACLLLTTISAFLFRDSVNAKRSVETLKVDFEESTAELARISFTYLMSTDRSNLFHLSNCYFDMRVAASLGRCGEDVSRSLNSWYEWGLQNAQSILSFFDSTLETHMEVTKNVTYEENWWNDWTFDKISSYLSMHADGILLWTDNLDE